MTANEFLTDQGWTDFNDGYIFQENELIELLDEYVGQKIDWKQLKEAYFNECTFRRPPKAIMKPSELFMWFKAEINEYLK